MRRIRLFAAGAAFAAVLVTTIGLRAQLPGYPVGIPQSVQSTVYGYLFGGTWRPAGAGAVIGLNATVVPQAGGNATVDGLYVVPTMGFISSALTTVTQFAGIRAGTVVGVTSGVTNQANLIVDTAGTGATNNYGGWLKGTIAYSGTTPRLAIAPATDPGIKAGTFTTTAANPATIVANGTAVMLVTIAASAGSPTSGVITLPTATNGWACDVTPSVASIYPRQTATAVDSVTISNYGFASSSVLGLADATKLWIKCVGY